MKKEQSFKDSDFDIEACSATDCTGLIPSLPQSDAELESYEALYPYLPHAIRGQSDENESK